MKIIYCDMVADLFHYGHVNFLKRCKQLGDYLIVGIHSDSDVESYKRKPIRVKAFLPLICEGDRIRTYLMVKRFYRPPPFLVGLHPHIFRRIGGVRTHQPYKRTTKVITLFCSLTPIT